MEIIGTDKQDNLTHVRVRLAVSVAAVIAMCAFIFLMSSEPADESDELSLGVAWRIVSVLVPGYGDMPADEQMEWQKLLNHPVRKTAHFTEYAVLGALMLNMLMQAARLRSLGSVARVPGGPGEAEGAIASAHAARAPGGLRAFVRRHSLPLLAWELATLYAATDEIHQIFVPGRAGMVTDVLLDSAGALTGVFLCWLLFFRNKRRSS